MRAPLFQRLLSEFLATVGGLYLLIEVVGSIGGSQFAGAALALWGHDRLGAHRA